MEKSESVYVHPMAYVHVLHKHQWLLRSSSSASTRTLHGGFDTVSEKQHDSAKGKNGDKGSSILSCVIASGLLDRMRILGHIIRVTV